MHHPAPRSRLSIALALVALAWIGVEGYKYFNDCNAEPGISTNVHIPVTNPPLEPDRPDLIEEPRIEDPDIEK